MAEKCKECGCECAQCMQRNDQQHGEMHLHVEIENLRQRLLERDNHIVTMETQFLNEADKFPNGELASIKEEILVWQEKYSRLYDAHKRVQKVNQNLEDKLLRIVDKCETEKGAFTKDIATLSHRLADANYTIHRLTQDNEKYRNDVNLAIQLLQCKPSNFVGQKYDSLPSEVQAKVRTYVGQKRRSSDVSPPDVKSITVPISTFPPTAMVYNVSKSATTEKHSDDDSDDSKPPVDIVSAAIMAKVLEDRERERIFAKHCDTCTCHKSILLVDAETQTASKSEPCNECASKCTHVTDTRTDSRKGTDAEQTEKQNFLVHHSAFQETKENAFNGIKAQHYGNADCAKQTGGQFPCAKEKVIVRNGRSLEASKEDNRVASGAKSSLSKKSSMRRNDAAVQIVPQSRTESANKQSVLQNATDTSINKVSTDKAKQTRANKRSDSQADIKSNSNCWNKFERKASSCNNTTCENSQRYPTVKEQSPIDIINDRLWKNEWAKLNSDTYARDNKSKRRSNGDVDIDVINDRAWRNDRTVPEARHPTQLTLIEVKNIDNVNDNDRQLDVATSPSYSSDSIVISTSDPSSSSSDVVHSIAGAQTAHTGSNVKSTISQAKITGPRNCLVRVTPGSKNILLDNVGHYKTVLYTSGSSKPNTALVHVKKGSRSGSERSTSASSDDNSPVLLHDNNQLQRVAEWVQSSVRMDKSGENGCKIQKSNESASGKRQSCSSLTSVSETKSKCKSVDVDKCYSTDENVHGESERSDANTLLSPASDVESVTQDKEKDLITFDTPVAEEKQRQSASKISAELDYEVKITKEMEETYLKLAASLDPAAFSLTSSDGIDMTIEKYRRDHRKLHVQKSRDRTGSTT